MENIFQALEHNIVITWHLFFVNNLFLPQDFNITRTGTPSCSPINHFPHLLTALSTLLYA